MTERQAPYVTRPNRETMIHHLYYCPDCGVSYAAAFPMKHCPECGRAFGQCKGVEHGQTEMQLLQKKGQSENRCTRESSLHVS